MLLGRNKKGIRVASGFLVKGIYDCGNRNVVKELLNKMKTLKIYGVNSQEFISVLAYVIKRETKNNNLSQFELSDFVSQIC